MGSKAGADMDNGLRINGEEYGTLFDKQIVLDPGGVDFFDGSAYDPELLEAQSWIDAIVNDTDPVVKPEEALVVTEILEAIYQSAETGKPVYLGQ